jgi:hypothetical protein
MKKEALRPIRAVALRTLLIEYAKKRQTTYYGQWMKYFSIDRFELAKVLGIVVELDAQFGTPAVASLVVRRDTQVQGDGFDAKVSSEGMDPANAQKKAFEFYSE